MSKEKLKFMKAFINLRIQAAVETGKDIMQLTEGEGLPTLPKPFLFFKKISVWNNKLINYVCCWASLILNLYLT